MSRLRHAIDRLFAGEASPWVYATLRMGFASVFLVRHSDWLRPLVFLQHHRWVRGLDFSWSTPASPALDSPLLPGLILNEAANQGLVYVRTALALCLLVGARPRLAAILLSLVSYILLASDRYRYFHHLHLLYMSIAWLSLAPIGDRLSLEHAIRRIRKPLLARAWSPAWPLQLLRAFTLAVYLAAGLSKLDGEWLGGETLEHLTRLNLLGGASWTALHAAIGYGALAKLVCLVELGLPALLAVGVTRRAGVVLGIAFHLSISSVMAVSTFGVQMVLLLLAFWPKVHRTHVQDA